MGCITREGQLMHRGSTLDVNSQLASELARHKSAASSMLRRAGIATPEEIVLPDARWAASFPCLDQLKAFRAGEIVVKPAEGTKGRGVSRHMTIEGAMHAARSLGEAAILLQKRVIGPELRVYVLHGRCIGGYWRRQHAEGFGNLSSGETPTLFIGADIPRDVVDCAVRAAGALGLEYAGIDLIVSAKGCVVLEVNASARFDAASGHSGGLEWASGIIDTILNEILTLRRPAASVPLHSD